MSERWLYAFGGEPREVTLVKLTVAALMIVFALFELVPWLEGLRFDRRYLEIGGLFSGSSAGSRALRARSGFLVNAGLGKEAFTSGRASSRPR